MRTLPLRALFQREKLLGHVDEPMLSVFRDHGVIPKDEVTNFNKTAEDRSIYQLVEPGWLVVNRMKAWQGSVGISGYRGIVSGHYICFRPRHSEHDRYLNWLFRSDPMTAQFGAISRGVRPGQIEIDNDDLASTLVPLPPLDEQRRIANFLDDQVARIDAVAAARQGQHAQLELYLQRACFDGVRGANEPGPRRASGIDWLGDIPAAWHVASVGAAFSVLLGKMLDEAKSSGEHPLPYLRNTNVQWDRIDTTDLKVMDFDPNERERFTVRRGDLLICEGGQPGRCAVWDGSITEVGYQKALHRARPRSGNDVRWLQNVLRTAVALNVFGGPAGQTTIGHLTGEQLREMKVPLPDRSVQVQLTKEFETVRSQVRLAQAALIRSIDLLNEYKRSLITAAVTGEFDVTTARTGVPA